MIKDLFEPITFELGPGLPWDLPEFTEYYYASLLPFYEKLIQDSRDAFIRFLCPNKRVVYLAYHAKKRRARDKNYKRMCRIVEKLGRIK